MKDFIQKIDNRFFFPFLELPATEQYYVSEEVIHFVYRADTLQHVPNKLKEYFEFCLKNWDIERFYFFYNIPCTIEPLLGWGITTQNKLIPQSLWNNYVHRIKPLFLKFVLSRRKKIHLKSAISLQYGWGNYWHFYNDILGQLRLADAAGLPVDTPVLIPEGLFAKPFFQQIMALSPSLQERNWVLQDMQTNVYCEQSHFFNAFANHRENFDGVLAFIEFKQKLRQYPAGNRRIFVGRNQNRGRNINNLPEVMRILEKYEFEYVECDTMSVLEQINVFQHAAYIIGIHGAGLTNIVYRQDRPLKLLEIFSADYWNPCYYTLCMQYDFDYFALVGSAPTESGTNIGNFTVDVEEFERQVLLMLQG